MFDTYAEIFARRASEYHFAMKQWPHVRDAEFHSVLEPLADVADGLVCDMPSGGGYLAEHLRPASIISPWIRPAASSSSGNSRASA